MLFINYFIAIFLLTQLNIRAEWHAEDGAYCIQDIKDCDHKLL